MVTAVLLMLAAQASAPPPVPPSPSPRVVASAKPVVDSATWVTVDDYPPSALHAGEQGRVTIEFTVTTAGQVGACTVTKSSGSAALDEASCRAVRLRARFTPAQDDQGHPIAITMTRSFVWAIPQDESVDIEPGSERTHLTLVGRSIRCANTHSDNAPLAEDHDWCGFFGDRATLGELFGADLPRARAIDIAYEIAGGDPAAPPLPSTATRIVLAEALFTVGPDRHVLTCTSRVANVLASFPLDLCASALASPASTFHGPNLSFIVRMDATITFAR